MSDGPRKPTAAEIRARLAEDARLLEETEREEEEERRRQEEEAAEAKRKADEEAERKRKADEAAERKRKADEAAEKKRKAENARYQQIAAQQQEEFEKDKADKVERARKREEEKQKRQKEGTARQTRKGTTATMGPGAQEAEGSGVGKKRKRVPDDDDDLVSDSEKPGSIGISITTNNGIDDGPTCGKCMEGKHECERKGDGACVRCVRLHLKCEWPGMTGKGKGREKRPRVGVTKKISGESDVGIGAVATAISTGFAEMTAVLKQQRDFMAGALGEIGESRRHIVLELERAREEMEITRREARRASDNMYAVALDLTNQLAHFWDLRPVYVERMTRPAEVYEEHGEGGQEGEGEETGEVGEKTGDDEEFAGEATGNVGEQTGDDEGNAGDGENGADEESEVSQTLRTQK
jgi:hypothetical protein